MKWNYFRLGFEHILDIQGYDHILFLVALCLPFVLKDWKKVLLLATAFTIGHSVTLACVTFEWLKVDFRLVEFVIPITIALTALYDLINNNKGLVVSYFWALFFGFIHGMGFSNFLLSSMLPGEENQVIVQLLVFNLGIEVGQIIIVIITLILLTLIHHFTKKYLIRKRPAYSVVVALAIILWSVYMAVGRYY